MEPRQNDSLRCAARQNEQIDSRMGAARVKDRRQVSSALHAGARLDAVQAPSGVAMAQAVGQLTIVVKASGDEDFVWDFEHTLSLTEPLRLTVQAWSYTYKVPESCIALETPQGQVLDLERSVWELGWKRDTRVVLHAVPVDDDYAYPSQSQMLSCRSFRTGPMSLPCGSSRSVPGFSCLVAPPLGSTASEVALDPARVVVALHAQLDDGSRLNKMRRPLDMMSPLSTIAAIWAASMGLPARCVGLETLDGEVVPLTTTPMDMGWQAGTAAELLAVPVEESYQGQAQKSFRCPQP